MKYNHMPKVVGNRLVGTILLFTFVFSHFIPFTYVFAQGVDTNSEGYTFAAERAKEVLGSDFNPNTIKQSQPISAQHMDSVEMNSFSGGESMSLMSQSDPLINTYLYDVANDVGNSQVSGMSGAFSHSIPIVVPPGRNGMQPSLEIQYSSQSLDDQNIVGYGWDIPLPYISRLNKKGTDVLYSTTTDQYFTSTMSGELATTSNASQYIAKNEDGSYLKYQFSTSTNQWTVSDKSGTVYKFGHSTSTRQDDVLDTNKVYKWMLEEVRDANSNYVKYEYVKDDNFIYPSLITYTGHNSTDGIFTVDFNLELRPDTATSSAAGFDTVSRYRLDDITIAVDGEWVRKYEFSYTTSDNNRRSLLDSVLETGRAVESNTTVSLPATQFDYQTSSVHGWATTTTDFSVPEKFNSGGDYKNTGTRIVDVNGDALPDIVRAQEGTTRKVYINDGEEWNLDTNWMFPEDFVDADGLDLGTRLADVNGDGLVDVLRKQNLINHTFLNSGTGWATTTSWNSPLPLAASDGRDSGVRLADINGDGLVDILWAEYYPQYGTSNSAVYLNTGSSFSSANWSIPIAFVNLWALPSLYIESLGTMIDDVNGDGLADLITGDNNQAGSIVDEGVFLNTGTGWSYEPSWVIPDHIAGSGWDLGQRLSDVNGDGLPDWLGYGAVNINNGTNWVLDASWAVPVGFGSGDDYSAQIADVNGDGLDDLIQRNDDIHNRWINIGKPTDLLTHIDESSGSKLDITYRSSAKYVDGSNVELNPELPFVMQTVSSIGMNDGSHNISTTTYSYEDGDYYYAQALDRAFAGFGVVIKTDPEGNKVKAYYHQGNSTETSLGEYADHRSKIGRIYRAESYDESGNLYQVQVNKWEHSNREGESYVAQQTRSTMLAYDGDSDHRDVSSTYTYSTTTGSLIESVMWGEVSGNADGSFTDSGSDKVTTTITYAASSTGYLILPSQETVTDQSATKVRETKNYYDSLSQGSITKGNLTQQELWKSGTEYINVEKTYNTYGLATQELDPRNNATNYSYDVYNLYPATSTNALSQSTGFEYDYSSGKVTKLIDANGYVFDTLYDGLDRILEEKQPDLANPSASVTKTEYAYTDTGMPRRIQKTDYLDGSTSAVSYIYLNGVGKKIEERSEAEENNTYAVKDYVYNDLGLLESESLPFFSTGTGYTGTSSEPASNLVISYTYDPLQRIKTVVNTLGTLTNAYDQWTVITTDLEGNDKESTKDAYGNLTEVVEHNGASEYTTTYEYDGNNKLAKITDAEGNIRNFTYDGLGRRATAQDLHDASDGTFGTWTYSYDNAGNIASSTDPKGQIVEYAYDELNRVLSENYTGSGGIEISYGYDACPGGIGKLCTATSSSAVTIYEYNALGVIKRETKIIDATDYATQFTYDRLGNQTNIIYPDASEVQYIYNAAGQLETVEQKESGGSFAEIISDFDYAPTGKVAFKEFANGVTSEYTYDDEQLYRLVNIFTTASSSEESFGGLGMIEGSHDSVLAKNYIEISDIFENFNNSQLSKYTSNQVAYAGNNIRGLFAQAETSGSENTESATSAETDSVQSEATKAASDEMTPDAAEEIIESVQNPEEVPVEEVSAEDAPVEAPPILETPVQEIPVVEVSPVEDGAATSTDNGVMIDDISKTEEIASSTDGSLNSNQEELPISDQASTSEEMILELIPEELLPIDSIELQLKADPKDVLDHKKIGNGVVKYAYKTNTKVDDVPVGAGVIDEASKKGIQIIHEVKSKRSKNARTFETSVDGLFVTEVISGNPQYYKDENGEWWSTDYATTTEEAYDNQINKDKDKKDKNLIEEVVGFFKETLVHIAKALGVSPYSAFANETDYFSDNGYEDGYVEKMNSTSWSTTWGASAGNWANYTDDQMGAIAILGTGSGSSRYGIRRSVLMFNVSGIDDHVIVSAALNLYIVGNSGAGSERRMYIVGASPASVTSLITDDFDQFGTTVYGVSDGSYTTNSFEQILLNATGTAMISTSTITKFGLRAHHDLYNITPSNSDEMNITIATEERTGQNNDSRLVIWHSKPPVDPTGLEVEGQTNPTSVTDDTPEFSAIFNDQTFGQSGEYETGNYYKIQVATSSTFSNTYWDSGKTAITLPPNVYLDPGERSPEFSYAGSPLDSGITYYWRIKFWDNTDVEGNWNSATSTFTMWNAEPTGLLVEGQTNPADVYDNTPEFSAVYNDVGGNNTATHYRIQVGTSSSFATVYWDSAQTALASTTSPGNRIQDITYAGGSLTASTTYYWRIKFWDDSNTERSWSTTTASFIVNPAAGSDAIQDMTYSYDDVGNITMINDYSGTEAAKTVLFTYDDLYRLTNASTTAAATPFNESYSYSAIGNITNKSDIGSYTYAEIGYTNPHAATTIGSSSLTYDNNGNLVNSGSDAYTWDYRDRMTASNNGSATTTYGYDHTNQRVLKTTGTTTTTYANDLYNTDGTTKTKHIYAGGELIATIETISASSTTHYIHADHLGSTNVMTDENAQVVQVSDYYPYGEHRIDAGTTNEQRKYIGEEYDEESGLSYLNARYYNGGNGKFISQDPAFLAVGSPELKTKTGLELQQYLSDPQGLNSYSYAKNNPMLYKDPSGNWSFNDLNTYKFSDWANSRPEYTAEQIESTGHRELPYYYRQTGDQSGTVRVNEQKFQDLGTTISTLALIVVDAGGASISKTAPATRFIAGVTVDDRGTFYKGTVDLKPTLDRIAAGDLFQQFRNDGTNFRNQLNLNGTRLLPEKPEGYYNEYVFPSSWTTNRPGPQRVITGKGGEIYYSPDHYRSVIPVN